MLKLSALRAIFERLSKRERIIFYCAVFFISLTLLDRLIIHPIFYKLSSLNEELKEKKTGIRKNLRILAHKDRILADIARYGSFLTSPGSEEEETAFMLKEIESAADKASIYLIDLKPRGAENIGTSRRYLVNLNCEAQIEQLIDFMYNIENSTQLLTIDKYQINPKSKDSSVARCKITIAKIVMP